MSEKISLDSSDINIKNSVREDKYCNDYDETDD